MRYYILAFLITFSAHAYDVGKVIDTNIKSIESFNLHKKRQEELSNKMKLQSREIHRSLMKIFSNIPEPRFLPRIDYQKGSEYFKNGFGKLTNITLPTFSFSDNENNTSDNWRTDNGNYSISVVEETD